MDERDFQTPQSLHTHLSSTLIVISCSYPTTGLAKSQSVFSKDQKLAVYLPMPLSISPLVYHQYYPSSNDSNKLSYNKTSSAASGQIPGPGDLGSHIFQPKV